MEEAAGQDVAYDQACGEHHGSAARCAAGRSDGQFAGEPPSDDRRCAESGDRPRSPAASKKRSPSISTRGVRALLARYAAKAGLQHNMPPHRLRHFLFTWLKTQGIDDALIQPYSGHETRTSLEIYSRLAITDAQREYDAVIDRFPV
ncbi:MAG: site-specific integrase [Actinomycetota bacterium]|nr:site-specific integrase [Actinomycetota bacterium]